MRPSRYLLLGALVAASTATATQHQDVRARSEHAARMVPRAPRPTPLAPSDFGFGSASSASASQASASAAPTSTFDPLSSILASASAASASSASAASASAAAAASSSAAAASASASQAAAMSSSIAAAAASSAAASISSADAARSSAAAASMSAASAASASRASASAASATVLTSAGITTTLTATVQATAKTVAPTQTSNNDASSGSGGGGGASTGLIIGVSVAGGVLVLATFIFLYFKFGTKRFSNFEDGDADIKWPELKHDPDSNVMQPLPARRTGGAGFDMGDESDGEGHDHEGANGMGEKGRESFSASTTALNQAPPAGYAVNDYAPGMDHYGAAMDPAAGAYYGDHGMYGQQHAYGMGQTSPGAVGGFSDNGNPYGVDPYAHGGMVHPQQNSYPHGHYQ